MQFLLSLSSLMSLQPFARSPESPDILFPLSIVNCPLSIVH